MKPGSAKTELPIQPQHAASGPRRTKRFKALGAALLLVAGGTGVANAVNILFNGTLDQTEISSQINASPSGWIVEANRSVSGPFSDGGDSETFCNVSPPSDPNGYGFFFKPFQGTLGPPADLITVNIYQDNPTSPNTKFTLAANAAGELNFVAFFPTNNPAPKALFFIAFFDNTSSMIASNGFDLVAASLPSGGPGAMSSFLYTTPQVTAPAGTVRVRAGASLLNAYNAGANPQNFFVDNFDLEATPPPGSPVITNQPAANTVPPGGTGVLTVGVSNTVGVSYQWQLYNTNISNGPNISGATSQTLTVSSFSITNVGHYRVIVSNGSGSTYSSDAPLALQTLNFFPVVLLSGKIGDTYRVDYATAFDPTTWIPLATNKLTTVPQVFTDTGSPGNDNRFYRSVFLH